MTTTAKVQSFGTLLNNIASALSRVGLESITPILGFLRLGAQLLESVTATDQDIEQLNEEVRTILNRGGGPTDEEWKVWEDRRAAVDARFARLKEEPPTQ